MSDDVKPGQGDPFELDESTLPTPPTTATDNERLLAGIAYFSQLVLPLVLPVLLLANRSTRRSDFVRHHAVQAIALVVVGIIYYLLGLLLLLLLRARPQVVVLGFGLLLLPPAFVSLLYAVRSLTGHWTEIPLVTDLIKDTGLL